MKVEFVRPDSQIVTRRLRVYRPEAKFGPCPRYYGV
jgi:hypothetical protein